MLRLINTPVTHRVSFGPAHACFAMRVPGAPVTVIVTCVLPALPTGEASMSRSGCNAAGQSIAAIEMGQRRIAPMIIM
jgi:hypothetical protein